MIDHFRLPLIGRLGQTALLDLAVPGSYDLQWELILAATGPSTSLMLTAVVAFGIAIFSATQDLAIDAYRITIIEEHETELIGHGAAMATCWLVDRSERRPGVGPLFWLADPLGWPTVYVGMALFLAVISVCVFFLFKEPHRPDIALRKAKPSPMVR